MPRDALVIVCTVSFLAGCGAREDPLAAYRAELGAIEPTDAAVLALSDRPELMDLARDLFARSCATCHAVSGAGLIGPNLTDDVYLNVRRPSDFFDVISYGRHAKGMPAWESKLGRAERLLLAGYAASLRGSPAAGKAPEGEPLPPWSSFVQRGGDNAAAAETPATNPLDHAH